VAACELLTAWQAARLRGWADEPGAGPAAAGGALALAGRVSGLIAPIDADRPLGPDIERLAAGGWLP
jgi:histidine ammonia-lyase